MRSTKVKIVNQVTGEFEVEFSEDGKICPSSKIDLQKYKVVKQYAAFGLIVDDIKLLLSWAKMFKDSVDMFETTTNSDNSTFQIINSGNREIEDKNFLLLASISIIHGRLFAQSIKRGSSLKRDQYVDNRFISIHNELMDLRNSYIAHSDDHKYEAAQVYVVRHPTDHTKFKIVYHHTKVKFLSSILIVQMLEYFDDLLNRVQGKLNKLTSILEADFRNNRLC